MFSGSQATQFFYKIEIYLDRHLVPKICVILNFKKIVKAVLENVKAYLLELDSLTDSQIDNRIFYEVGTYLDRLFVLKKCVIPNFVKLVRRVLENVKA